MPYTQITFGDLLNAVYQRLGDNLAITFWRQDEAIRFTNESLRLWNLLTGLWRGRVDMGTTNSAQVFYSTPLEIIYGQRLELNGVILEPGNLHDLDFGQPGWQSERCTLGQTPQVWAPIGIGLIALWPSSYLGGESLIIEGVLPAPQMDASNLNDIINLPKDDMANVAEYAAHILRVKEGGQEFQASQEQFKLFLKGAGQRNSILMQSAKYRQWMGLGDRTSRPIRAMVERVGTR